MKTAGLRNARITATTMDGVLVTLRPPNVIASTHTLGILANFGNAPKIVLTMAFATSRLVSASA